MGGGGNKEYEDDVDKVNGYEVNGGVVQWCTVTRNGAAHTLEGYTWEVSRGAMSWWWSGWVAARTDGNCNFSLVLLSCLQKMEIWRVERGCERNSSQSG